MDVLSFLRASARSLGTGLGRSIAAHRRRWTWGILTLLAGGVLLLCAPVAWAAVQLNYFNVISFPTSVTLEWSTASEVNLAGFDVQCKLASEPDSAFHEIGYVRAKGGPDVGALYTFEVNSNIVPGVSYCFRLKEITTDGSPGDVLDRCGYGPLVTPTPGLGAVPIFTPVPVVTDAFGNPVVPTATVAVPAIPAVPTDAFGNPLPPTATPFFPPAVATDAFGNPLPTAVPTDAFGNPIPPAVPTDAFGSPLTPTATIFPPPVPTDALGSPLLTPTPIFPSSAEPGPVATDASGNPVDSSVAPSSAVPSATDAFGNPVTDTPIAPAPIAPGAVATDAFGNPIQEPQPTLIPTTAAPDAFGNPVDSQAGSTMQNAAAQDAAADPLAAASAGVEQAAAVVVDVATPTPAFVVVTATPTQAPVALAPVLTPLPTATPIPAGIQLASTLDPGQNLTQNLLVMLLCVTFVGASGIGIVGLITSVMFMRSRSSQRDFYEGASTRRRL